MRMWRYFISSNEPDTVETGRGALLRLETGDPWALAEVIGKDGEWVITERMARYYLLGSTDTDINETTPARARQILLSWHQRGRLERLPAVLPGDDEPEPRSPETERARELLREQAQSTQRQIEARYAEVPTPPGAHSVADPTSD